MKVVQINAVYQYSSTGRMTKELHDLLKLKGYESWVFCTNYSAYSDNIFKIGNKLDQIFHALGSRLMGLQGYFSKNATSKLLEQLDQISPDVVHLHNLHANYINFNLLFSYLANKNIATVVTLHDCWFFTGHCCHYTEDKCDKWLSGCGACRALHKYNNSWFFDRTKKIYTDKKKLFQSIPRLAIVGNSNWTTNQAEQSFLRNSRILKRIYNWIDLDTFYPRQIERKDKFIILGVAQEWSEKKGLSILIEIANHYPEFEILLVGSVQTNQSLPENIKVIGVLTSKEELALYYSRADLLINSSIQETFGLVSAEALACGTPIIVNNATANPELVSERCGYVVENSDINTYYDAIDKIKCFGKAYYADACVRFARENFEMDQNIEEYIKLYERIQW